MPNPKYAHQLRTAKVKLEDRNEAVLMGLDWKSYALHQFDTHYCNMMALLQLATDPFTNEIEGDLQPCLLASKASQALSPDARPNATIRKELYRTGLRVAYYW
jgi:hypothetical protein